MKRLVLVLSCLILASCGGGNSSAASSEASSEQTATSSAATEVSEAESEEAESSEEEAASSEETVSEAESDDGEIHTLKLGPEHFPSMGSNGYTSTTIEAEGYHFDINDCAQNNWKQDSSISVIQMKKQSATIESKEAIKGTLAIAIRYNSYERDGATVDTVVAPTVSVSATAEGEKAALSCTSQDTDDYRVFTYAATDLVYYSIANEADYAQYTAEILWVW